MRRHLGLSLFRGELHNAILNGQMAIGITFDGVETYDMADIRGLIRLLGERCGAYQNRKEY